MLKRVYSVDGNNILELCETLNVVGTIQDDILSDHVKSISDDLLKLRDAIVVTKLPDGRYMGSYMNDTRFYICEEVG